MAGENYIQNSLGKNPIEEIQNEMEKINAKIEAERIKTSQYDIINKYLSNYGNKTENYMQDANSTFISAHYEEFGERDSKDTRLKLEKAKKLLLETGLDENSADYKKSWKAINFEILSGTLDENSAKYTKLLEKIKYAVELKSFFSEKPLFNITPTTTTTTIIPTDSTRLVAAVNQAPHSAMHHAPASSSNSNTTDNAETKELGLFESIAKRFNFS